MECDNNQYTERVTRGLASAARGPLALAELVPGCERRRKKADARAAARGSARDSARVAASVAASDAASATDYDDNGELRVHQAAHVVTVDAPRRYVLIGAVEPVNAWLRNTLGWVDASFEDRGVRGVYVMRRGDTAAVWATHGVRTNIDWFLHSVATWMGSVVCFSVADLEFAQYIERLEKPAWPLPFDAIVESANDHSQDGEFTVSASW